MFTASDEEDSGAMPSTLNYQSEVNLCNFVVVVVVTPITNYKLVNLIFLLFCGGVPQAMEVHLSKP